jgi:sugar phosphate isomerase/epimerase
MVDRRGVFRGGLAALVAAGLAGGRRGLARAAAKRGVKFKLGVTDWTLKLAGQPEAVLMAGELGFDCLQVSIGRFPRDGKLVLSDKTLQQTYLTESKRHKCPIRSLYLDILHVNGLKWREDPLGQRWVAEAITIAKALKVKVILLPFFGKQRLENQEEIDYVADALKELAPTAARAAVILGIETTLSAQDNLRLIERARSRAVQVYYDVGNAHKAGLDAVAEIRLLGRDRLAEVHLKDNPHYLGEGQIDFGAVIDALSDVGFDRQALLETDSPSGDVEVDLTRNQAYVRRLIDARNQAAGIKKRG